MEHTVLCACSAYDEKYYLSEAFAGLPAGVKDELKIMCVLYTAEVGGVLVLEFDGEGSLLFQASAKEGDLLFDEIGSGLKIKQMRKEKRELLASLELFYRAAVLKQDLSELLTDSLDDDE